MITRPGITRIRLLFGTLFLAWSSLTSAAIPSGTMVFEFAAGDIYDISQFHDCDTEGGGGFSLTVCLDLDMVPNGKGKHTGTANFTFSGNVINGKLVGPASGSVHGKIGGTGRAMFKLVTSGKITLPDFPEAGKVKTMVDMNCSGKIDVNGYLTTVCKGEISAKGGGKERIKQRFDNQLNGSAWAMTIDVNPVSAKKFTGTGSDSLGYIYKVNGIYNPKKDISEVEITGKRSGKGAFVALKHLTDTGVAAAKIKVQGYKGRAEVQVTPPPNPTGPYTIGGRGPAGGIVFYITPGGLSGLEAAHVDQSAAAQWGCRGLSIIGADGTAIGTGAQNTADILAGCADPDIAARLADNYSLNGFDDWFLPSQDELNELYLQRAVVGNFTTAYFWSSSEGFAVSAWGQDFNDGSTFNGDKDNITGVRAIRAF